MPDKARTMDDIRLEYSNLVAKIGNIEYQVYTLQKEANLLKEAATDLNLEANKLTAAGEQK